MTNYFYFAIKKVMKTLGKLDLLDVLQVSREVIGCNKIEEMQIKALKFLESLFKVEKTLFLLTSNTYKQFDPDHYINRGIEDKFLSQYFEYYHKLDPLPYFDTPATILTNDRLPFFKQIIQSEYFNDFLKPQSIYFEMAILLRSKNQLLGVIGLDKSKNEVGFSTKDITKAQLLIPYLSEALEKTIIIKENIQNKTSDSFATSTIYLESGYKVTFFEPLKKLGLTRREVEIVYYLCKGYKNHKVAEKLFISEYTVINHLSSIYKKCKVHNRTSLLQLMMNLNGKMLM